MRTRPPASSSAAAVAPRRRPSPPPANNDDAACGKAGKAARRRDAEVRRKMEALRGLVPSGGDEVDELLLRAAGYIARLQAQVTVMHSSWSTCWSTPRIDLIVPAVALLISLAFDA